MPPRHPSQRPVPDSRGRGAVASRPTALLPVVLALLAALLSGCGSDAVEVETPALSDADAEACAALIDRLPDALAGQTRRPVSPSDAPAAAWGDPAIVLTCGVPEPEGYDEYSACIEVMGTGWFATDDQLGDLSTELVATELTRRPRVQVVIPPEHRAEDPGLPSLAGPVREVLRRESSCR